MDIVLYEKDFDEDVEIVGLLRGKCDVLLEEMRKRYLDLSFWRVEEVRIYVRERDVFKVFEVL